MARKRASMREGPLAELFRATEAAQRQAAQAGGEGEEQPAAPEPEPEPEVELPPAAVAPPPPAPTASPVTEVPSWQAGREAESVAEAPPTSTPEPVREPAVEERETRWVEPLPEQPPRLWAAPPTRPTIRSSARSAARTWSSSPRARAAAPVRALRR